MTNAKKLTNTKPLKRYYTQILQHNPLELIGNFHQKSVTLPPTRNFMESIKVHDKTFVPYLEDAEIQEIVKATALKIYEDYKDEA